MRTYEDTYTEFPKFIYALPSIYHVLLESCCTVASDHFAGCYGVKARYADDNL